MAIPLIASLIPTEGPSSGGDLVRVTGEGFAPAVEIRLGGVAAVVLGVRNEAGTTVVDLRTPEHAPGVVDLVIDNLDEAGAPIPGEFAQRTSAYRFVRTTVARESDLTRVVRHLLRELKQQVLANVSATVSVDYDDTPADQLNVIAVASIPALVLAGPTVRPNRFYSMNELTQDVVLGPSGPELRRRRPPFTVDLGFTLTATSERTAELLNLMAAVATFLNRNRWVELFRDPDLPSRGEVRWELDVDGEFRTQPAGKDDVRAFSCGFVVRGFDLDEGLPFDWTTPVTDPQLRLRPIPEDP